MSLTPHVTTEHVTVFHGDCLDVLRRLPDSSVHAVITDPPYGLRDITPAVVAKTLHRWLDGDRSYAPAGKGYLGNDWDAFVPPPVVWDEVHRVLAPGGYVLAFAGARTVDLMTLSIRLARFEIRDSIAWVTSEGMPKSVNVANAVAKLDAAAAEEWAGYGTSLKPANEPIVVARKALDGTTAHNALTHGAGGLNIDATRIPAHGERFGGGAKGSSGFGAGYTRGDGFVVGSELGRWPTNVILDSASADDLDATGAAWSRYFPVVRYEPKAPDHERGITPDGVKHPTTKPLALLRWLVKLSCPPGGVVLDPFAGSGTTAQACDLEQLACIAIEREEKYLPLITERLTRDVPLTLDLKAAA